MTLRRRIERLEARTRPQPEADTGARQRLADRIARLVDAANTGDAAAVAQLDRLRDRLRHLTEGRTP